MIQQYIYGVKKWSYFLSCFRGSNVFLILIAESERMVRAKKWCTGYDMELTAFDVLVAFFVFKIVALTAFMANKIWNRAFAFTLRVTFTVSTFLAASRPVLPFLPTS